MKVSIGWLVGLSYFFLCADDDCTAEAMGRDWLVWLGGVGVELWFAELGM